MNKKQVAVYRRLKECPVDGTSVYMVIQEQAKQAVSEHEDWELAGIYLDEGGVKVREGFERLLFDCKAGKINIILAQSTSRFGRNSIEAVDTALILSEQQPPVGVVFQDEKLDSLAPDGKDKLYFIGMQAAEQREFRSNVMRHSHAVRKRYEQLTKEGAAQ